MLEAMEEYILVAIYSLESHSYHRLSVKMFPAKKAVIIEKGSWSQTH